MPADRDHAESLRILFVCQNDFGAPSEKQVLGFAQQLVRRSHRVLISVGGDPASAEREGASGTPGLAVRGHRFRRGRLRGEDLDAARDFAPHVVHAWNTRTPTEAAARALARASGARLLHHFEDDEWHPSSDVPGEPWARRGAHRARRLLSGLAPELWWESTPRSLARAAREGDAFDALTPVLAEEVTRRTGRPCATVLPVTPAVPAEGPAPEIPASLAGAPLVLITGTVWPMYLPDFEMGFRAVAQVQRRGVAVGLLHAGRVLPRWDLVELAEHAGVRAGTVASLGYLPFGQIPGLLRRADVLLQPGPPSDFNRLRLPSKLQAYLASGTPVLTFGAGFGELLADRREVLKTHTGDPGELADRLIELLEDGELRETLSREGPRAAARLFDPEANASALEAHYRRALHG